MAARPPTRGRRPICERVGAVVAVVSVANSLWQSMDQSLDEIFDDANGDLAVGDLDSAVEKYRRCVDLDSEFFDGWHALGMALMKLGHFPEAIEAGKKATELRPNDQIAWTSLSLFYNRAGDIKEAEGLARKRRYFRGAARSRKRIKW